MSNNPFCFCVISHKHEKEKVSYRLMPLGHYRHNSINICGHLTFLGGNRSIQSTRTLVPKPTSTSTPDSIIPGSTWHTVSGITMSSLHLGSQALVIVEEASLACARQMFGYYSGVSGKTVDIIPARWLHRASKQEPSRYFVLTI